MSVRVHLISNMYPSAEHPSFGIFVKEMSEKLAWYGEITIARKTVITRKPRTSLVKFLHYLSFYARAVLRSLSGEVDLVYAHYVSHTALPIIIISLLRPSLPIVINIHGSDVAKQSALLKIIRPLSRFALKHAALVVMPSSRYAEMIHREFGLPLEKLFVSPSGGIDLAIFHAKERDRCRSHLRINSPFVLGYIARVDHDKRWPVFFQTLKLLVERGIDLTAVTVTGNGNLSAIRTLAAEYGLTERVRIFGDIERSRLPLLYGAMDLFLFPSIRESLGLVGLESMACGVPIVSADSIGVQEYLNDGKNGFFAKADDPADFADKAYRYLTQFSTEQKNAMMNECLHTATRFSAAEVSRNLAKVMVATASQNHD